jgi:rhodanese-related sulfurtransferase
VADEEAFEMCLRLNREESIIAGPSSGMALAGALKLVPDQPGVVAVVVFPDNVFKYTSSMQRHFPRLFPDSPAQSGDEEAPGGGMTLNQLLDAARRSDDVIDVGAMEELLDGSPPPLVLDVRPVEEYQQERMEGSINVPLARLVDAPELPRDKDATIVTVCNTGRKSLSGMLLLKSLGYRNVRNLMGGLAAWSGEGHPLEY